LDKRQMVMEVLVIDEVLVIGVLMSQILVIEAVVVP